jgi:peptide/nickel transport system permease protein
VRAARPAFLVRAAFGVLALWALIALAAPWWAQGANAVDLGRVLAGPAAGAHALLGYDELGRPLADRTALGARGAALVAGAAVLIAGAGGTLLGLGAALRGGTVDLALRRLVDALLAFPGIVLALALAAALGPGRASLTAALALSMWMGFARLARGQALTLRGAEHVLAARALGCGPWRILRRHLLPRAAGPLLVHGAGALAAAVVAEAGLSFLGLGVPPPESSWGGLLREAGRYLPVAPHYLLGPGLALGAVTLAAGILADAGTGRRSRRT